MPARYTILISLMACTLACSSWARPPGSRDPGASPVVAFDASPLSVAPGGTVRLSWAAENAKMCEASGAWSGRKDLTGAEIVSGITATSTFTFTCKSKGLAVTRSAQVVVEGGSAPSPVPQVELAPASDTVPAGGTTTLTWNSTHADRCMAGGAWSGEVGLVGTATVGPLQSAATFSLTCDGAGGSAYAAATVTVSEAAGPEPTLAEDPEFQALLESVRDKYDVPAVTAVVARGGLVEHAGAAGVRALGGTDAVTAYDQWHLGSLTKAFTGTLAGALVERSFISWDTRPVDLWPEIADVIRPEYANVTLKHLLYHTSGLPVDVLAVPSLRLLYDGAAGTIMEKRRLWAEELLSLAPETSVGKYHYTNAGYIVAGAMLETVTGSSWEDLLRSYVFGPLSLSLTSTGFGAPSQDQPYGHRTTSNGLEPVAPGPGSDNIKALGPAGTMHTSLADYTRFMFAHLDGEKGIGSVVAPETFQFLHTPPSGSPYAIGWYVLNDPYRGGRSLVHAGSNTFWWAQVRLIPGSDLAVFVAVNAANANAQRAVAELEVTLVERALAAQ